MRILIASELDISRRDGSTTHLQMLVRELVRKGHDVVSVFPRFPDPHVVHMAGRTILVPLSGSPSSKFSRGAALLEYQRRMRRLIPRIAKREHFDVAYVREGIATFGLMDGVKDAGLPLAVEVNGIISDELPAAGLPPIAGKARDMLAGPALRKADHVVAVSDGISRALSSRYGIPRRRLSVVRNGVDPEAFRPLGKAQARREFGLPEEGAVVVWTGYMASWQGLGTLLDAWSRLEAPATLALAGTGPLERELKGQAHDAGIGGSVRFLGQVPFGKVPLLLSAADIAVAPFTRTRNEAIGLSPLKVYEYMACALPVVASDISGLPELLDGCGVLCQPDSPSELADALTKLLADADGRSGMGARGREKVLAGHTWSHTADGVLEVLRGIANGRVDTAEG